MYSADFKWRAVTLHYASAVPCEVVGRVLGVPGRAVRRGMHSLRRPGTCWPKREMLALCTQLSSWRSLLRKRKTTPASTSKSCLPRSRGGFLSSGEGGQLRACFVYCGSS
ncbi:hypothetical protein JG688_00016964 [Phytophthora aleatoria]|uniref:Uncharacterized protein n=1 Tax=Phytophthora aleatoria TaxID=2496075 RepID=A0A8J5I3M6_9STRA|nr:hypothetical protein JG688_00016964 [Phytophthora aleatoria]